MDISSETNVQKLKAMAYDELTQVQFHQRNLQVIEAQIAEVTSKPTDADPESDPAKS